MSIGDYNRRVEIWKPSGVVDAANEVPADGYVLHKPKWVKYSTETGMATIRAAAQAGGINTPANRASLRCYYDPSINETMHVRFRDGSRATILAVRHDEANRDHTDIVIERGTASV